MLFRHEQVLQMYVDRLYEPKIRAENFKGAVTEWDATVKLFNTGFESLFWYANNSRGRGRGGGRGGGRGSGRGARRPFANKTSQVAQQQGAKPGVNNQVHNPPLSRPIS